MLWTAAIVFVVASCVVALDNGVGRTPAMGYSSWNDCSSAVNEERIKNITRALIATGLAAKGYIYVNVDEGWLKGRDNITGRIVSDPIKFPSGMKALGDWIHNQVVPETGEHMRYGLYTSRGTCQCSTSQYHAVGSHGFERQDAEYFAASGADYLKEDSCCGSQDHTTAFQDYAVMRDALNATGRTVYFSLCGWHSWYAPVGPSLGNSWRIAGDGRNYAALVNCMNVNSRLSRYAGPGGWNDPDLLIGTGVGSYGPDRESWYQNDVNSRTQFSMWCVMAAPLLISANINVVSAYALKTWGNEEAIAVNQDALGRQGFRVVGTNLTATSGVNVWARPLANTDWAAVFVNNEPTPMNVTCDALCFAQMPFRRLHSASEPLHPAALGPCNATHTTQHWHHAANGSFIQRASLSCLDLWECATQPNSTVALFHCDAEVSGECGGRNQQWIRTAAHELRSGLDPALCLDQYHLTATGRVDAFPCNGGANQQWHIEPLPHDPRFSLVRNVLSGLCLTGPPAPHSISLIARDLWLHRDIASIDTALGFTALVPANGASRMFRFRSLNTL